jgi:hypothetical protein
MGSLFNLICSWSHRLHHLCNHKRRRTATYFWMQCELLPPYYLLQGLIKRSVSERLLAKRQYDLSIQLILLLVDLWYSRNGQRYHHYQKKHITSRTDARMKPVHRIHSSKRIVPDYTDYSDGLKVENVVTTKTAWIVHTPVEENALNKIDIAGFSFLRKENSEKGMVYLKWKTPFHQ